jgi:hypothetical protein
VLVAYLAGGFVIPYTIHAIFLLCLAILPFDLNWLPDTRIFRSALVGLLAVSLPVLVAPSHNKYVAVGVFASAAVILGIAVWLEESTVASVGPWIIVTEIVSAALATILVLVLFNSRYRQMG